MFLSIVAAFCDKDCKCIPELLDRISTLVHVSHEVILIDNRKDNKDEIDFGDAKVYTKGYNTYQFEARRYAVQFCSGTYIWFVDADDVVFTVKADLEQRLKADVVIFDYAMHKNVITLPRSHYVIHELFSDRFKTYDRPKLKSPTDSIWDLVGCTLWNKWIKRSLMISITKPLPENWIIVASEDILYCSLILDKCHTVCFCKDIIYCYQECFANGNSDGMTDAKFEHIILGHDKARYLGNLLLRSPKEYLQVDFDVAYFYTKLIHTQHPSRAFRLMTYYFSSEELKEGLNHDWVVGLKKKYRWMLHYFCKRYL